MRDIAKATDVSLFPKALPLTLYASDIQIWTKKRQISNPPFLKSSPMHKNTEYIHTYILPGYRYFGSEKNLF